MKKIFSNRSQWFSILVLVGLFSLGLGLRLINLTSPPLDFHAWRQLRAACIARGMYYEMNSSADTQIRQKAIDLGKGFEVLEPRIFERLVAVTYLLTGGEHLWVARLYAILFWMVGGVGIYALGRRLGFAQGAWVSVACYLLAGYGIRASRSFQPDPFMVMWVILAAYGLYAWSEERSWKWALLAGFFSGMAILIKVFAVYPIAILAVLLVLYRWGLRRSLVTTQVWVVTIVMSSIPASYYLLSVGGLAPGYISGWVLNFSGMLSQPAFYVRWLNYLRAWYDLPFIMLGLASIFLVDNPGRLVLGCLWAGYLLIGLSVPSLIITHDYYNLLLLPIASLSIAPLAQMFLDKLFQQPRLIRLAFVGVLFLAIGYPAWIGRNSMVLTDYRAEVLGWQKMGKELPKEGSFIGITHDYNTRLQYYGWVAVAYWPLVADEEMHLMAGGNTDMEDAAWEEIFTERTQGYDYFIVTDMGELDAQPVLCRMLEGYPSQTGEGYILYDLRQRE